jgi:hypothetical protein
MEFNIGRNITVIIEGNTLTATVDLSVETPLTTTGKNDSISTTGAPQQVGVMPDGRPLTMNLSVYAPVPASRTDESIAKQAAHAAAKAAKKAAAAA